jgi:hypothetical protein
MLYVRVEICRYVDHSQPGWVECRLIDAEGVEHVFTEKVPVVTDTHLDDASSYPQPGLIACHIVGRRTRNDGSEVVSIDTQTPWGVQSKEGVSRFDVPWKQLVGDQRGGDASD